MSLPSPSPVSAIASQPSDRDPLISTVQTLADPARAPLLLPTPPSPTVPPPCASLPPPHFAARPSPCFAVAVTSLAPAPHAGSLVAAAQPSPSRLSPPSRARRCGRGDSPLGHLSTPLSLQHRDHAKPPPNPPSPSRCCHWYRTPAFVTTVTSQSASSSNQILLILSLSATGK